MYNDDDAWATSSQTRTSNRNRTNTKWEWTQWRDFRLACHKCYACAQANQFIVILHIQRQQLFNFDDTDLSKDNFYVQRHWVLLYCYDFRNKIMVGCVRECVYVFHKFLRNAVTCFSDNGLKSVILHREFNDQMDVWFCYRHICTLSKNCNI